MAAENQMGVRPEGEISLEVFRQLYQDLLLAADQSAGGIGYRRPGRRKIDAVERESRFKFHHLWWHRWFLHLDSQLAVSGAATAVVYMAHHGIAPRTQTSGFKPHGGIPSADSAATGLPGVGQRIVVRIASVGSNLHHLTGCHGITILIAAYRGGWIGLRFH